MLPVGPLHKDSWEVRPIDPSLGRNLIVQHHYSRSVSKLCVACFGLFHKEFDVLFGVTWWLPPTRRAAEASYEEPNRVLSLSRMVLIPSAPKNSASFMLSKSVKMLDTRWKCLVTYADTWQGHTGEVYKSSGWTYVGKTTPTWIYTKNGISQTRKRGKVNLTHQNMLDLGFTPVGKFYKHKYVKLRKVH